MSGKEKVTPCENSQRNAALRYYKQKCERQARELKHRRWNDDNVLQYLSVKLNKPTLEFTRMQLTNCSKKPNGRRYNFFQRNMALAMYRQSPKKYRFLKRMFILPSKSTIASHSAHLLIQPGIDPILIRCITEKVKQLSEIDQYCVLTWDEMALRCHLDYSPSQDVIHGFVDVDVRLPLFATHALTFMIRGINSAYKQLISFHYTENLNSQQLAKIVAATTEAVLDTGLNVIGSVCDQTGVNVACVNNLINPNLQRETPNGKMLQYKIRDHTITHCWDPPHLIKVTRNNLEKKDLRHYIDKRWDVADPKIVKKDKLKTASWSHIAELYQYDRRSSYRLLPKLTDEHIKPDKDKMKVSTATQVFSKTVGEAMLLCASEKLFPQSFSDTADILMFFNDLFDSFNGSGEPQRNSLKGSINENSIHFAYWTYALSELTNMSLVNISDGTINNSSTVLKKFESTIRGFMELTRICLNAKMREVSLRNVNQDGLENFFGCCKSNCNSGKNPIPSQYRSAYTTVILNNLIGPISSEANCQNDNCVALVSDIESLFLEAEKQNPNLEDTQQESPQESEIEEIENEVLQTIIFAPIFDVVELGFVENESVSRACSEVCRKLLEVTDCDDCKRKMHAINALRDSIEIIRPSQQFQLQFKNILTVVNQLIPELCHEKLLMKKVLGLVNEMELEISCSQHNEEASKKLKICTINYAIVKFCNNVNNLLSGKVTQLPQNYNDIEKKAYIFKLKRKRIGKFSDIFDN